MSFKVTQRNIEFPFKVSLKDTTCLFKSNQTINFPLNLPKILKFPLKNTQKELTYHKKLHEYTNFSFEIHKNSKFALKLHETT